MQSRTRENDGGGVSRYVWGAIPSFSADLTAVWRFCLAAPTGDRSSVSRNGRRIRIEASHQRRRLRSSNRPRAKLLWLYWKALTTKPTAPAPISTTTPSPAAVRDELERVVAGPIFAQSDRLVSFLRFIVNETLAGRADQIKESIVGIEVFGRAPGYDPKVDPIVRVQARQLRQKLRDHYDHAGLDDTLIIDLPKGRIRAAVPAQAPR